MATPLDFSGKVILVTGSSSGIGEGIALLFAKCGGQVIVTGRDKAKIAQVVDKCALESPNGKKPLGIAADVSRDEEVKMIVEKTIDTFGRLDVLVNNAGIFKRALIEDPNIMQTFDAVMGTNLRSVLLLSHLSAPHLIKTKGCIINISSCASTTPFLGGIPYSASKCGLDMITRIMAVELGPKGVRVNAVNPAIINTPIFETLGATKEMVDKLLESASELYPVGRYGETQDVAEIVAFLASDKASFITGVALPVDGGYGCTFASSTRSLFPKNE